MGLTNRSSRRYPNPASTPGLTPPAADKGRERPCCSQSITSDPSYPYRHLDRIARFRLIVLLLVNGMV